MRFSRVFISVLALGCCLAGPPDPQASKQAAGKTEKKAAKSEPKPAAVAPKSTTIPKEAKEIEPGIWSHPDETGKVWLYRRTPFGIARYEPEPVEETNAAGLDLVAIDEGDRVSFERRTPFGVSRWKKKKSELSGDELAAFQRLSKASKPAVKE
jgi:hypothetical protein